MTTYQVTIWKGHLLVALSQRQVLVTVPSFYRVVPSLLH